MATTTASGTQTATLTTEHSLTTTTTAGVFVLSVNCTNLLNGETVRIRVKTKVLTGDTAESIWDVSFTHSLGDVPIIQTPPLLSMFSYEATLRQDGGTGRAFPWSVVQVDA